MSQKDRDLDLAALRELVRPLAECRVANEEAEKWVKQALASPASANRSLPSASLRAWLAATVAAGLGFGVGAWWFGQKSGAGFDSSAFTSVAPAAHDSGKEQDRSYEIVRAVLR